jgi:GWxTD domain-containing protein
VASPPARTGVALLLTSLLASAAPLSAVEDPVQTTLAQVKLSYRAHAYDTAEAHLRNLVELAAAPERAGARDRIMPAYHFYAAAVAWERKDEARAKEQLLRFFTFQPDATLDPAAYGKAFRIFFDAQRTAAAEAVPDADPGPQSIAGGVLPGFAHQDLDEAAIPYNTGEASWVDSPVRFLLSDGEKEAWRSLPDDETRRAFVQRFWERLDPKPETPRNEYQLEFYRRVQYADANFSSETAKGSQSDRGMVFIVLGPPSYVGKANLDPAQDVMTYMKRTEQLIVRGASGGAGIERQVSNRIPTMPGDISGDVETWYFRRERIPQGLPFHDLKFVFISRTGYGSAVLQKEPIELTALSKAVKLMRHAHD